MNILVVSDTHGDTATLKAIVSRNQGWCDLIIHLGDNLKDAQDVMLDFPAIAFLGVMGNCDYPTMYRNEKYEGTFTIDKKKIFYTHGHKYNVKYGAEYLVSNAKFNGANIALYGHSHEAVVKDVNEVLVINPGSTSFPRDGSGGTYAKLVINNDRAKCDIVEVGK